MNKIEALEKKIANMTEKYNAEYENPESMANDLLDMAEGIMYYQAQLINLYKNQIKEFSKKTLKEQMEEWENDPD
jgi:cell division septum initiation protein DivIVA